MSNSTNQWSIPPISKLSLTPPNILCERLQSLIGQSFPLSGKTRTDGSNLRKLVENTLLQYELPAPSSAGMYTVVPPKEKGVPRMLRDFLDTYIVTTGTSYNLQVWNRNPASNSVQIEYDDGPPLLATDVRFIFVRVDPNTHEIRAVIVLTPEYITNRFGKFGKPTIKHQLIISERERQKILSNSPPIIFHPDDLSIAPKDLSRMDFSGCSIHDNPTPTNILPLSQLRDILVGRLLGTRIDQAATKNRGQALELAIAQLLGYHISNSDFLVGGYPDNVHQALEIKVQDSPTVDLGKFSPQFMEDIPNCPGFTTSSIRYLIALTDAEEGIIQGLVLCPGSQLGNYFTYVAGTSFKCQRSIPMSFFENFDGLVVFNP